MGMGIMERKTNEVIVNNSHSSLCRGTYSYT
jgi:hypothetical protein